MHVAAALAKVMNADQGLFSAILGEERQPDEAVCGA